MALIEKTAEMDELTGIRRFLRVEKDICTGGQPRLVHLEKLKAEGIKAIINLRPMNTRRRKKRRKPKSLACGISISRLPLVIPEMHRSKSF
jgi:protein tyrosine phosphatase (PTP) superfamily phosphohydrolase (DUF442 family)